MTAVMESCRNGHVAPRYANGNCTECAKVNMRRWRARGDNAKLHREQQRAWRRMVRREAAAAYGDGSCATCGFRPGDPADLELDHVNGDGAAHRLALTGHRAATTTLLSKLRRLGWPNDPPIQTLCHDCHKTKTKEERCSPN